MEFFKEKKIQFLALGAILIIAAVLRLWEIGKVPPSPDWDEVALGYNAYSIGQTGRDEYGAWFPIILRSFDDYKPAFYAYLIIPIYKLMGLSVAAVRMPSAVFGILTVLASYYVVRQLLQFSFKEPEATGNTRQHAGTNQKSMIQLLPMLTALLLAISPWHIQFSRIAFESNVGLAFNVFGILFFLRGLRKPWLLVISAACMGIALYIYQSEKVFTPLLALLLVAVYFRDLLRIPKKYLILASLVGFVIALPIVAYTVSNKEALSRARGVSVFSMDHQFVNDYAKRNRINKNNNDVIGLLLDNRRILYGKFVIDNYLSHFNISWLFLFGDQPRHHAPDMGLLYIWEFPFLLIGIYTMLFGSIRLREKLFIWGWFFITPIPAAFTTGVPHSVRTLNFLPTFQIFTAMGVIIFLFWLWRFRIYSRALFLALVLSFIAYNLFYYLNQYFVQQNYFVSEGWQYGYKEAVRYVSSRQDKYEKIIVSNKPHLDQSYMFFLFYLKYSPALYQEEVKKSSGGFRENHVYGKYEFRPIVWGTEKKDSKYLYVGLPTDFPYSLKPLKIINFLNGNPAIYIVEG